MNAAQLPLDVEVSGLPQVSRVENQLKLKVKITSETPLNQSMLYLPSDSISREKFYLKKIPRIFQKTSRKIFCTSMRLFYVRSATERQMFVPSVLSENKEEPLEGNQVLQTIYSGVIILIEG